MRPRTAFVAVLVVVAVLAAGLFFVVSRFSFSDLGNIPASVKPSGPTTPSFVATITTPAASTAFFTVGQSASFVGGVSGGSAPFVYSWNFGDGTSGNGQSVAKTFNQAGTHNVVLTVTDSAGLSATDSVQAIVLGASFISSITSPPSGATLVAGQTVTFLATASGGVTPYEFSWEFGDGGIGAGPSFSYVYTSVGTYTVTMRVSDSSTPNPVQLTKTIQITVSAPQAEPLQATIVSPSTGEIFQTNQAISFSGSASGGSGSYLYRWEFGDGSIALTQNATKTYAQANTYTVSFKVSDNTGNQTTTSVQITVNPFLEEVSDLSDGDQNSNHNSPSLPEPLQTRIDAPSNNSVFQTNQTISFSGSATGGDSPYRYRWNFGDGGFSAARNTSHIYAQVGGRTVTLEITDADNNTDSESISLNIQAPASGDDPPLPDDGGGGSGGSNHNNLPTVSLPEIPRTTICTATSTFPSLIGPFSFGMRDNAQVFLLQKMLTTDPTLYPEGIISGFYGPLTRAAVQRFQLRYGILTINSDPKLLGFAGPTTRAKIQQVLGGAISCPVVTTPTIPTPHNPAITTLTLEERAALADQLNSFVTAFRQNLVSWLVNLGSFLTP